ALPRARRRRGDALPRAGLELAVRERIGSRGRVRDLPVLDGDARHRGLGGHVEPDPPGSERGLEGGTQAGAGTARDAALDDPPREHAPAAAGRGGRAVRRARLLPRRRVGGRPRRLRRRALPRPARGRERARPAVGSVVSVQSGVLPPDAVRTMFDRIAPVYDLMNRVMTAGLDGRWRRLTAEAVVRRGNRVLDACCGTGDLALADERAGGRVVGLDFSERMLERARRKSESIEWTRGDLLELPFEDASFEAATVGFGVRNVGDLERSLRELR